VTNESNSSDSLKGTEDAPPGTAEVTEAGEEDGIGGDVDEVEERGGATDNEEDGAEAERGADMAGPAEGSTANGAAKGGSVGVGTVGRVPDCVREDEEGDIG
jgi:hypothetical protein